MTQEAFQLPAVSHPVLQVYRNFSRLKASVLFLLLCWLHFHRQFVNEDGQQRGRFGLLVFGWLHSAQDDFWRW
jgi:hypothetical protein